MHPIILFNPRMPGELEKARAAGEDILSYCIDCGGSITGEHGVGMEKNELMAKLFPAGNAGDDRESEEPLRSDRPAESRQSPAHRQGLPGDPAAAAVGRQPGVLKEFLLHADMTQHEGSDPFAGGCRRHFRFGATRWRSHGRSGQAESMNSSRVQVVSVGRKAQQLGKGAGRRFRADRGRYPAHRAPRRFRRRCSGFRGSPYCTWTAGRGSFRLAAEPASIPTRCWS